MGLSDVLNGMKNGPGGGVGAGLGRGSGSGGGGAGVCTGGGVAAVVAVCLGWLILAEPVTVQTLVGGVIVVAAVAVVVRSEFHR